MSRIGDKIKSIRAEKGMNQKTMAKKLGVSEGYLNEVENGRKVPAEDLIKRLTKLFGKDVEDISISFEAENIKEEKEIKTTYMKKEEKVKDVWSEAFGDVLVKVPIQDKYFKNNFGTKLMALLNNKIEGYSKDKVFYLKIEDDDMAGYRISEGDIAFAYLTSELINNSICLVEYGGERIIRQLKKLDNNKLLLLSNRVSVRTTTAENNEVKILARLLRLEITL